MDTAPAPAVAPTTERGLTELIIHLYTTRKLTTRAILKALKDEYNITSSQPTITRRVKAFNDGKIDATGKEVKQAPSPAPAPKSASRKSVPANATGYKIRHFERLGRENNGYRRRRVW